MGRAVIISSCRRTQRQFLALGCELGCKETFGSTTATTTQTVTAQAAFVSTTSTTMITAQIATTTEVMPTTTVATLVSPATDGDDGSSRGAATSDGHDGSAHDLLVGVIVAAVLLVCAALGFGYKLARVAGGKKAGVRTAPADPTAPMPGDTVSGLAGDRSTCLVHEVLDDALLRDLSRVLVPPDETRATLGVGRDADKTRRGKYTKLQLQKAWRLVLPMLKRIYDVKLEAIQLEMRDIEEAGNPKVETPTPTLLDWASKEFDLDWRCNEKLLLHGTTPQVIEAILKRGLDERYTAVAAFGFGVYLADDPSKTDQYCRADTATTSRSDTQSLHQILFKDGKTPFKEDVFYMLICRTLLGYPIYTKGPQGMPKSVTGPIPTCEPGHDVYVNGLKRQLKSVPGTVCPYHSLIVMKGTDSAVLRHQEFIVPDGKCVLPVYLVAYTREP